MDFGADVQAQRLSRLIGAVQVLMYLGPAWVGFRLRHALDVRLGRLKRRTPMVAWTQLPAPELTLRCWQPQLAETAAGASASLARAEAILGGEFQIFSSRVSRAGFPPDWHSNVLTGERAPANRHWSELGAFDLGDVKGIWELSRFPWAFSLARAYAHTRDEKFAEGFWVLFENWCAHNPPNRGANWWCGQEATFRLVASVFAVQVLARARASSTERMTLLARFVVATGRRIAANLDYALSQKNNHGVSECVGLVTAALAVQAHAESACWLARGLRELQRQLAELVYADGSFSQHSLIYHRLLLQVLTWCRHRLDVAGVAAPEWLDRAGRRALALLERLTDPGTGLAPLFGANDGASVLPLADAHFLDMRPSIQAAAAVFRTELPLPPGPWDEAAVWMTQDKAGLKRAPWPEAPERWYGADGGYVQVLCGSSRLFMRCPTRFRHRPSQVDMLHMDVWYAGQPVAMDGGTFSYNSPERFAIALPRAAQHNVLTVDGQEPMTQFSPFLYLPWPKGTVRMSSEGFQASHNGFERIGVKWTREVQARPGSGIAVCDRVVCRSQRRLLWHWRLADLPWRLAEDEHSVVAPIEGKEYVVRWRIAAPCMVRLLCADAATAYGWWSPTYGSVQPAVSLLVQTVTQGAVTLTTEFLPNPT